MTPCQIIPTGPAALWYELREWIGLGTHEEHPEVSEMAYRIGVSDATVSRYLNTLEMVGLVERRWRGIPGRDFGKAHILELRDTPNTDKRTKPCKRCWSKAAVGRWCPKCRQLMRRDRVWRDAAIKLATVDKLTPMQIHLRLSKLGHAATLFDSESDEDDGKAKPGVITVLHERGLCPAQWVEAQRNRKAGVEGE